MRYLILSIFVFVVLVGCGKKEEESGDIAGVDSVFSHWADSDLPVYVHIHSDLVSYDYDIAVVVDEINGIVGREILIPVGYNSPSPQFSPLSDLMGFSSFNGIFRQWIGWDNSVRGVDKRTIAFVQYWRDNNRRISRANLVFNFYHYQFTDRKLYPTNPGYDFKTILRHELGHFLGLPHERLENDPESVMVEALAPWEVIEYSQKDKSNLRNLYLR